MTTAPPTATPTTNHPFIVQREALAPWLAASFLALGAYTVGIVVGAGDSLTERVLLTVGLCSVVTATQLVLLRVRRADDDVRRAQRERPARDELTPWADDDTLVGASEGHLPPFAYGMWRYSKAVVELLEHSVDVALNTGQDTTELVAGRDDAAALHNLLTTMAAEPVQLNKAARVHTICSLWEASQERCERVAAAIDPEFHRRWRARHIATLRLRHGERPRRTGHALPYRSDAAE